MSSEPTLRSVKRHWQRLLRLQSNELLRQVLLQKAARWRFLRLRAPTRVMFQPQRIYDLLCAESLSQNAFGCCNPGSCMIGFFLARDCDMSLPLLSCNWSQDAINPQPRLRLLLKSFGRSSYVCITFQLESMGLILSDPSWAHAQAVESWAQEAVVIPISADSKS